MTPRVRLRFLLLSLAGAALLLPAQASACSVCMGDPNSKAAGAINGALFLLLGFVGLVLGGVGAFAWNLKKRAGLSALATGILVFLFWDVTSHGVEPIETHLESHSWAAFA